MLDLAKRRVLVLGLGMSGRSAAAFCAARGAEVVAADERNADDLEGLDALDPTISLELGASFPDPGAFDLVVPSPGIPAVRYRAAARRVWGDVELAGRALSVPIVAITGTNGKSTTTRLVEAMLRGSGLRARAAGNLGTPALSLVGEGLDVAVLEVSSFQLETVDAFRPAVAVILNIAPDHLDRHGDLESYVAAKARILAAQQASDTAVLNFGDPTVRELASRSKARLFPFRAAGALASGVWIDAGAIALAEGNGAPRRFSLDGLRLVGAHNRENAAAALAAAVVAGADPERAMASLAGFEALPHRTQLVANARGVRYVDDSKATNPSAAASALASFSEPIVWIGGGRAKGLDLGELAEAAVKRARAGVLIGESAPALARALAGRIEVHTAASIEAAVEQAARVARPGEVVLLAPGCASQDQFRDFRERGERFRAAALLQEAQGEAP